MGNVLPFYQRRTESSDPFLWVKGVPGAETHRMMSVQYGGSVIGLAVNGSRGSKMVAQVLSMGNELDTNPHPLLMQTWNEPTAWSCRTDGWLLKWHINCKLVVAQPMKVSTTDMPSMKSQSISQNYTKRNIWTSANGFWIAMVPKVTIFWKESSFEMKRWPTITNQRVNSRVWNGNMVIHPPRKSLKRIQPQESLCLQLLEHYQERT